MGVRRMLAVWAAKISEKASVHIFHRQGVTWAGKIALKIDPSILHDLAGQVRKDIFIVCGTNGKTTTNNMLCAAIEKEGYKVICNHTGSNMLNGVVAAFVWAQASVVIWMQIMPVLRLMRHQPEGYFHILSRITWC